MKKLFVIFTVLVMCFGLADFSHSQEKEELVVYAYDSFISWGLAEATMHKFEKANNCKITLIAAGDAGQVMSRVVLEKENPQA
ncbi:MAG: thiamine ABC transporter substrate-binding protein, partial [Deltaproteobacteria bacterium]|nr:thiamine ABC transporter substrate-binding protein [Deltaproteobacteria bacterium]